MARKPSAPVKSRRFAAQQRKNNRDKVGREAVLASIGPNQRRRAVIGGGCLASNRFLLLEFSPLFNQIGVDSGNRRLLIPLSIWNGPWLAVVRWFLTVH